MGNTANFHYLTPLLFPLMPTHGGNLVIGLDLKKILDIRAIRAFTGTLTLDCAMIRDGVVASREALKFEARDGNIDDAYFWRRYPADGLGYVEISITADQRIFTRIDIPVGYGLLTIPDYGTVTVIPDAKFARPIIIEQMQATKTFCLVHSAGHWDSGEGHGNSFLFVNPYEQDIVITLQAGPDRKLRQKVPVRQAISISIDSLLKDGEWRCVMITGNNRIPVWDVRHQSGDSKTVNSIDHLDVFRGGRTHAPMKPVQYIKTTIRRFLRRRGIII